MTLENVSFNERYVRVTGKGGHQRLLPFDDQTWDAFSSYMKENPSRGGPVIRSLRHSERPIGAVAISQLIVLLMYAANIKQAPHDVMSGHALRHTACVDMLRAGSSVRDVQAALGHVSLATTQAYMPMVIHGLRRAMGGRYYGDASDVGAAPHTLQLALPGMEAPREDIGTLMDGLDGCFEDDEDIPPRAAETVPCPQVRESRGGSRPPERRSGARSIRPYLPRRRVVLASTWPARRCARGSGTASGRGRRCPVGTCALLRSAAQQG